MARLGSGHIHDTWEVRCEARSGGARFVLQRINERVFRDPAALMDNLVRVTAHLRRALVGRGVDPARRCLELVPSRSGAACHADGEGGTWRCFRYVEGTRAVDAVESPEQARQVARAFAGFAGCLSDLPPPPLAVTIPDFHDRGRRLDQLAAAADADRRGRAAAVASELDRATRWFDTLEGELAELGADALPRRVVHHDGKVNNVLLDSATGEALCVIDLDTVMEGDALSDFGELVRTATFRSAEDEVALASIRFEPELFDALARGYAEGAADWLAAPELAALPRAGLALALMNAIRFLTDYLEGDVYFRAAREGHNLDRCRAQLQRVELLYEHRESCRRALDAAARAAGLAL